MALSCFFSTLRTAYPDIRLDFCLGKFKVPRTFFESFPKKTTCEPRRNSAKMLDFQRIGISCGLSGTYLWPEPLKSTPPLWYY